MMIATPDHTHAVITMAALKRGKHVYCEKPLTWSVAEARQVTEAARRAGVATQLGNQGQATEEARVDLRDDLPTARSARCARCRSGARRGSGPGRPGKAAAGDAAGARGLGLGLWLGPAPASALPSGVSSVDVAQLVGLRHRPAGRPGLPQALDRVQGPEARPSHAASKPARRS